jgi:F420-dependent oxidoreductase-like protein
MVGSDKERSRADRLAGLLADGKAAESEDFASFSIPQVPGYLDAMTAVALLGQVTERIEIGTAIVPIQTRHPLIMAQQALTTQIACSGRFTLGMGPSHHWIISDQLGLPYERPARLVRDYLDVLDAAFAGSGAVAVDNDNYRVHSPVDGSDAFEMPVLLAALGPTMLRIAGERTDGTILWLADERAIGDYVVPRITAAAQAAGRSGIRVVAGVPVTLCPNSESGRGPRICQRGARPRGLLPQLCSAARARRRPRRRRHHGGGRRIVGSRAVAPLPQRGRHRSRRPVGAARTGCTSTWRVAASHSGVRRVAVLRIGLRGISTHELHRYAAHRADEQNRRPAHRYRVV